MSGEKLVGSGGGCEVFPKKALSINFLFYLFFSAILCIFSKFINFCGYFLVGIEEWDSGHGRVTTTLLLKK